ncbi:MAG: hypothetical protein AAF713_18215 [Pseudomonadota bacterium]
MRIESRKIYGAAFAFSLGLFALVPPYFLAKRYVLPYLGTGEIVEPENAIRAAPIAAMCLLLAVVLMVPTLRRQALRWRESWMARTARALAMMSGLLVLFYTSRELIPNLDSNLAEQGKRILGAYTVLFVGFIVCFVFPGNTAHAYARDHERAQQQRRPRSADPDRPKSFDERHKIVWQELPQPGATHVAGHAEDAAGPGPRRRRWPL